MRLAVDVLFLHLPEAVRGLTGSDLSLELGYFQVTNCLSSDQVWGGCALIHLIHFILYDSKVSLSVLLVFDLSAMKLANLIDRSLGSRLLLLQLLAKSMS